MPERLSSWTRLRAYLRPYTARYLLGIACLAATATFAMAIPVLLKRAVDSFATADSPGNPALVARYALAVVAIALVQAVVRTFSRFVIFNVGRDIEYDLRNDLFAHLERLPLAFYQTQQTGDLMSRLVNDVTAVRMLLGVGHPEPHQHADLLRLRRRASCSRSTGA